MTQTQSTETTPVSVLESLQLKIGGMSCSFCVSTIEKAYRRTAGVRDVHVSLAHEEALVRYEPDKVTPEKIRETLRQIRRRQPAVEESLVRGRGALETELCGLLIEKARNGDVIASLFLLKARCGWREGELPPGTQVINAEAVQINMPGQLTAEQFEQLLDRSGNDAT